jgi:hypothetical protein
MRLFLELAVVFGNLLVITYEKCTDYGRILQAGNTATIVRSIINTLVSSLIGILAVPNDVAGLEGERIALDLYLARRHGYRRQTIAQLKMEQKQMCLTPRAKQACEIGAEDTDPHGFHRESSGFQSRRVLLSFQTDDHGVITLRDGKAITAAVICSTAREKNLLF